MDVRSAIRELAEREFGDRIADVDFWGPLEGEDMMGELVLKPGLTDDEIYERLDRIYRSAGDKGWRVLLDWVSANGKGTPSGHWRPIARALPSPRPAKRCAGRTAPGGGTRPTRP